MIDCINTIIGLSRNECECFEQDRPSNYDASDSGLYLDELSGLNLNLVDSLDDCSVGSLWDLMEKARSQAILMFQTDLLSQISKNYNNRLSRFDGKIGGFKAIKKEVLRFPTYIGQRIDIERMVKGGVLTINSLSFKGYDGNANNYIIPFKIFKAGYEEIYSGTFTYNQNQFDTWHTHNVNVDLSLFEDNCDDFFYDVVLELPPTLQPYNNEIDCGCSKNKISRGKEWKQWFDVQGFNTNGSLPDVGIQDNSIVKVFNNRKGFGIVLDVSIYCNTAEIICDNAIDYTNNKTALAMSYAIRFKAGELLAEMILSSNEPNRFTLLEKDVLAQYVNEYRSEYEARILYISDQIDITTNDCLVCNSFNSIMKTGIFK